jgi:hypothetical protein
MLGLDGLENRGCFKLDPELLELPHAVAQRSTVKLGVLLVVPDRDEDTLTGHAVDAGVDCQAAWHTMDLGCDLARKLHPGIRL